MSERARTSTSPTSSTQPPKPPRNITVACADGLTLVGLEETRKWIEDAREALDELLLTAIEASGPKVERVLTRRGCRRAAQDEATKGIRALLHARVEVERLIEQIEARSR